MKEREGEEEIVKERDSLYLLSFNILVVDFLSEIIEKVEIINKLK